MAQDYWYDEQSAQLGKEPIPSAWRWDDTYEAGIDLRSCQYALVKFSAAKVVSLCTTSGEQMCGILQNNPNSGLNAVVRFGGRSQVQGAKVFAAGALLTTNHSGRAFVAQSGDYYLCQAMELGSSSKKSLVIVRANAVLK